MELLELDNISLQDRNFCHQLIICCNLIVKPSFLSSGYFVYSLLVVHFGVLILLCKTVDEKYS